MAKRDKNPAGAPPEAAETPADDLPPAGSTWNPATQGWDPPSAEPAAAPEAARPRMRVGNRTRGAVEATAADDPPSPENAREALAPEDDESVLAYLRSAEYGKALKNGARAGVIQEAAPGGSMWQLLATATGKGGLLDRWFWTSDRVNQRIKDAAYTVLEENGILKPEPASGAD